MTTPPPPSALASVLLLRCPYCTRSIQIYPDAPDLGYFRRGSRADVCLCCGTPLRLLEGYELAIASWNELEFRSRSKTYLPRFDLDDLDSDPRLLTPTTKRSA